MVLKEQLTIEGEINQMDIFKLMKNTCR